MLPELAETGAEHIKLDVGRKSLTSLLLVRKLIEILRSCQPDILHARSRLPAWLSYLAWSRIPFPERPAFITSVHGPYSVNRYSRIMTAGERVIAISNFIENYILENYPGVDREKIHVIPRGIDSTRFPYGFEADSEWLENWKRQLPIDGDKLLLTLPARVTRWKGQEDFVQVIAGLHEKGVPAHGLIVGSVESRRLSFQKELEQQVRGSGLQDHISFLGHRDDVKEIMSVSDIVMSLSREPEAFGRISLEALSIGSRVVAYDHGGASEVLREMFPVGLVKPLSVKGAIDKVIELAREKPAVPNRPVFTLERMLNDTLDIYEQTALARSR